MDSFIVSLVGLFVYCNGASVKMFDQSFGDSKLKDVLTNMDIPRLTVYTGQSAELKDGLPNMDILRLTVYTGQSAELKDVLPNMDIPRLTVYTGQSDTESFMIRASLKDKFSSKGPYTVFGPSNLAWFELSSYWRKYLFLNTTALREVMLYHTVGSQLYTTQFHNEKLIPSLLPGYNIRLNIYKHNTVFTVSGTVMIKNNQNATNGVVHMLNSVMLIPVSSIYTNIQTTTGLTILRQAVKIAGLDSLLNGTNPLTMFTPSDAAFIKLPAGELNKLLSNPKRLADILEYHILRGTMYTAAFYSEDKVPTYNKQSVLITNIGGQVEVNGIELALQDISTTNGVIHVIDTLLLPPTGL